MMVLSLILQSLFRITSLWVGFTALQKGIASLLIVSVYDKPLLTTLLLALMQLGCALLLWLLSPQIASHIVGAQSERTPVALSISDALQISSVFVGLIIISCYGLNGGLELLKRVILIVHSGQFGLLLEPSLTVTGVVALLNFLFGIGLVMHSDRLVHLVKIVASERSELAG